MNFIAGAGGYLQNFVDGYAGLRYTRDGITLRPVLPPHSCESLALRGLSLAGRRVTILYTGTELTASLTDGSAGPLSIGIVGGDVPVVLAVGVPKTFPIAQPGRTVFSVIAR